MDIKILSDQMYGVEDDSGVQIAQKPIPDELKSLSDTTLRLRLRDIEQMPPVEVAAPLPPTEKPVQVAHHEHPEYLREMPTHSHELHPHGHMLRDEDEKRLAGLEFDSRVQGADLLRVTGELRGDILRHDHPGYSGIGHQHEDVNAIVETLTRRADTQLEHFIKHEHPHDHPEIAALMEQLVGLRATVNTMSLVIERLGNRITELEARPMPESIRPDMAEIDRLREELFGHITEINNRPVYYTAELSQHEQGGVRKFVVQEAPR